MSLLNDLNSFIAMILLILLKLKMYQLENPLTLSLAGLLHGYTLANSAEVSVGCS